MIPAGPGFVGNWEVFALGALRLYAAPARVASHGSAFVVGMHAFNALWYIVVGALALMSPHVSLRIVPIKRRLGPTPEYGGEIGKG